MDDWLNECVHDFSNTTCSKLKLSIHPGQCLFSLRFLYFLIFSREHREECVGCGGQNMGGRPAGGRRDWGLQRGWREGENGGEGNGGLAKPIKA